MPEHQKSTTVNTVHISAFSAEIPYRSKMPFWSAESRSGGREQATSRRTSTRTVDDCETPCPPSKLSLGPQTSLETSPAPRCETLQGRTACWTTPSGFGDVQRMQPRKPTNAFWHPGVVNQQTRWPHFGSPTEVP